MKNDDIETVISMKRCLKQIRKELEAYYKSLYNVMAFCKEL